MKRKFRFKLIVLMLSFVMLLSACGNNGKNQGTGGQAGSENVASNEEAGREDGVFDINIASEPELSLIHI